MVATLVFNLIKYGVASGAVSLTELFKSEKQTLCRLSGNLCDIQCPQFTEALEKLREQPDIARSVVCQYRELRHDFLTIGQVYFVNRTNITKQSEDRDFLYRIITGDTLLDENDTNLIYTPLETVGGDYTRVIASVGEMSVEGERGKDKRTIKRVMTALHRVEKPRMEKSRKALALALETSDDAPKHVKNMLAELEQGIIGPNHFSMHEYISIMRDYIEGNTQYKQKEIMAFLTYLITAFVRKDDNDFPSARLTEKQIATLINETAVLPDDHPFKWTNKRKKIMYKQENTYRKLVYCDDYLYLWKVYVQTDIPIDELTEADIRTKYLVDTLLQKACAEYSTKIILFKKFDDLGVSRIRMIFRHILNIIDQNDGLFTLIGCEDLLLPEQINNQHIMLSDEPRHKIEAAAKEEGKRRATPEQVHAYLNEKKLTNPIEIFPISDTDKNIVN